MAFSFQTQPNPVKPQGRSPPPSSKAKIPGEYGNRLPGHQHPPYFGVTALPGILLGDVFVFAAGDRVLAAAVIHPPARLSWALHGKEGGEKSIGVNRPVTPSPTRTPG